MNDMVINIKSKVNLMHLKTSVEDKKSRKGDGLKKPRRKGFGIPFAKVDFAENRSSRALLFTDRQSIQLHERPKERSELEKVRRSS